MKPQPEPVYWIAANAAARDGASWYNPESLCRTCIYIYLQPFCESVNRQGKEGTISCDGYELETEIDIHNPLPSYCKSNWR